MKMILKIQKRDLVPKVAPEILRYVDYKRENLERFYYDTPKISEWADFRNHLFHMCCRHFCRINKFGYDPMGPVAFKTKKDRRENLGTFSFVKVEGDSLHVEYRDAQRKKLEIEFECV